MMSWNDEETDAGLRRMAELVAQIRRPLIGLRRRLLVAGELTETLRALNSAVRDDQRRQVWKETELLKSWMNLEEGVDSYGRRVLLNHGAFALGKLEGFALIGPEPCFGDAVVWREIHDNKIAVLKVDAHGFGDTCLVGALVSMFELKCAEWKQRRAFSLARFLTEANNVLVPHGIGGTFVGVHVLVADADTGDVFAADAGDRIISLFQAKPRTLARHSLKGAPPLGVFTTDTLPPGAGFSTHKLRLQPGDAIVGLTDGLEQQHRLCRTPSFEPLSPEAIPESTWQQIQVDDETLWVTSAATTVRFSRRSEMIASRQLLRQSSPVACMSSGDTRTHCPTGCSVSISVVSSHRRGTPSWLCLQSNPFSV